MRQSAVIDQRLPIGQWPLFTQFRQHIPMFLPRLLIQKHFAGKRARQSTARVDWQDNIYLVLVRRTPFGGDFQ